MNSWNISLVIGAEVWLAIVFLLTAFGVGIGLAIRIIDWINDLGRNEEDESPGAEDSHE